MSERVSTQAAPAGSPTYVAAWAYVFVGFTAARILGLLFSVAASRLLTKADFGSLAYALAIASFATLLLSSAPVGLSRYLVMHQGERAEQNSYYSNWLFLIGLLLAGSLAATPLIGWATGLDEWTTFGVAVNLVGITVLEAHRESQRGADQYFEMAAMYVGANLLQVVVIVLLGWMGVRSAPVYLAVFGLSPALALLPTQLLRPVGYQLRVRWLSRARMLQIARFCLPVLVQSVCFAIWFGADVVLLKQSASLATTGEYSAAKTLAVTVVMPASTLATVVMPRAARLSAVGFRFYLIAMSAVAAVVSLPLALAVAGLGRVLVRVVFGARYEASADVLPLVAAGMALWGCYQVTSRLWIGYGRPGIDLACTVAGALATLAAGLLLIPILGMLGAGLAFTIGSGARLVVIAGITVFAFREREYHAHASAPDAAAPLEGGAVRPLLIVGERGTAAMDSAYTEAVANLTAAMQRLTTTLLEPDGHRPSHSSYGRMLRLARGLLAFEAPAVIEQRQPRAVLVVVSGGVTLLALLRARLLKYTTDGSRVVIVSTAPIPGQAAGGWWSRWLMPDRLITLDDADRQLAAWDDIARWVLEAIDASPRLDGQGSATHTAVNQPTDSRA